MTVSAADIAHGLNAKRYGDSWRCPCPACGEKNDSKFKITQGSKGPLVYCFAGCDFRTLVAELEARGLWESPERDPGPPDWKIQWARWVVTIYEDNQRNGRYVGNGQYRTWQPSAADRRDYRKARGVLKEAEEVSRAA